MKEETFMDWLCKSCNHAEEIEAICWPWMPISPSCLSHQNKLNDAEEVSIHNGSIMITGWARSSSQG
jgi:hypothetical protein